MSSFKEIRLFRTIGLSPENIRKRLENITKWKNISISFKSLSFGVDIELVVEGENQQIISQLIKATSEYIRKSLSDSIYGTTENESLERVLGCLLCLKNLTLGIAESCTGGLVSHFITNIPGSSSYFKGGIVAYSNDIKINILGVSKGTIEKFGAVSKNTAEEMAIGVRKVTKADLGLSITGILGPLKIEEKPIGLVYIGLSDGKETMVKDFLFSGDRNNIKEQSAYYAMDLVRRVLIK